jgi:tetratricopeptide (TPR) repeat protein
LYLKAGQVDLAKEMLKKMEASATEVFGEQSFERGRALMSLAGCYEQDNDMDEAIKTLESAIALENYGQSKDQAQKAVAANAFLNLGIILNTQGKSSDALPHFEKALAMKKAGGLAKDHPDILEVQDYINQAKEKVASS